MADYDAQYWLGQISLSAKSLDAFRSAGRSVVSFYLNEYTNSSLQDEGIGEHKLNMFWANIGILKSALYGNPPKPIAAREFQDPEDDVGRVAAAIIERLLRTGSQGTGLGMHEAFQHAVEDRLIPGMGQVWLRYDVTTSKSVVEGVEIEQITDEDVSCDYVYWQDFSYSPARVWEEVYWVARRVWMTPTAMQSRFPEYAAQVPLVIPKDGGSYASTANDDNSTLRRGEIYEIWCKTTKKVYWVAKGLDKILDEQPDPLEIPDFFPCPKPLISNTTTTKLIPRADYTMVQDQYAQLNSINVRLGYLTAACKAVGVYDKSAEGVQRMLRQGVENDLIPVDNWAMFAEKGGIKGVVDWLPIESIVAVIVRLRESRVDCVQQIYELTGISDIMRGVTNARETYGAQQLKAQYSSSRLQLYQMQVGQFVSEAMNIKANIIAKHFQPKTIYTKSLVQYTPDREFAEPAIQLIKDSWSLMYRINVSSTQMSIPDYNAEKQMRQEFVTSMGQFVSQVTPLIERAPKAAPFMLKILQWAAASFATSGGVETLFDNYIREVEKGMMAPPPPNPEAMKLQAEQAAEAQRLQAEQAKSQFEAQVEQNLAQLDAKVKFQIAQLDAQTKENIAGMQIAADARIEETKQGNLWQEELNSMDVKASELKISAMQQDLANKAAALQVKSIVDDALLEIRNIVGQCESKMREGAMKAKQDAIGSSPAMQEAQEMSAELMASVGEITKSMQALTGQTV